MSSQEDYYTSQPSPLPQPQPQPQHQYQQYPPTSLENPLPPPPPPKPSSQDISRISTPQPSTQSPRPQPPRPTSPSYSTPLPPQHLSTNISPIQPPGFEQQWLPTSPPLAQPLQSNTTAELIPILSDQSLLSSLASTHPSHASSLQPISSALESNIQLAQRLSQLETHIESLRAQTQQLVLQHTTLSTQWRRKQSEMDNALSPWGPRAMYQRLVSSINEQESLVKAMQESFLEGDDGNDGNEREGSGGKASDKEVNEWVRRIREGTTVLEKRREMRSRWDEGRNKDDRISINVSSDEASSVTNLGQTDQRKQQYNPHQAVSKSQLTHNSNPIPGCQ